MKNILFFIESLSGGGAEKVLVTLLKHIDYTKYNVSLLTISDVGVLKNEVDFSKISYRSLIKESQDSIVKIWNKIKYKLIYKYLPASIINSIFVPQKNIDTYIAFTEGLCTKILAHTPRKAKKVAWVHIDLKARPWTIETGIYKNIENEKRYYQKYNTVIAVSNSVEKIMRKEYALDNTITIYNPIDCNNIIKLSKQNEYTAIEGFNIISIGRLVTQKGYDLLIPIVARLIKEGQHINLYLLGDGVERENLELIAQIEGIEKYVHFTGYVKNPYPLLKEMDLFVCSSRSEGYSLALAEALTLGIPAISTNCSGPNELLDDNKYGQLCSNYEEFSDAIRRAAIDTDYYNKLKEKAIARRDFFNIKRTIEEVEKIL